MLAGAGGAGALVWDVGRGRLLHSLRNPDSDPGVCAVAFGPDGRTLAVATAALEHAALTRRPVPDYLGALRAERTADVVLAALYRRGMLNA